MSRKPKMGDQQMSLIGNRVRFSDLVILALPMEAFTVFTVGSTGIQLSLVLAAICLYVSLVCGPVLRDAGRRRIRTTDIGVLLLVFVVLTSGVGAWIRGENLSVGLHTVVGFLAGILAYATFRVAIDTANNARHALDIFLGAACISATYALYQTVAAWRGWPGLILLRTSPDEQWPIEFWYSLHRAFAFTLEPNHLAAILLGAFSACLILHLTVPESRWYRWCMYTLFLGLVATKSTLVYFLPLCIAVAFVNSRGMVRAHKKVITTDVLVLVVFVVIAVVLVGPAGILRTGIQGRLGLQGLIADPSNQHRLATTIGGLREFADYPILGMGPGYSNENVEQYMPIIGEGDPSSYGSRAIDSLVVSQLAQYGLLGALAWAVIGFGVRPQRNKKDPWSSASKIALYSTFFALAISRGATTYSFWFLLALSVSNTSSPHLLGSASGAMEEGVSMTVMMYAPVKEGGLADYSAQLCNALAERGCTIILLTCAGFSPSVPLSNEVHLLPRLRPVSPLSGFRSLHIARVFDRSLRYLVNCLIRQYWVYRLRPSILHLQLTMPIYDQFLIPLRPHKVCVIMTVHDVLPHQSSLKEASRFLRHVYLRCDSLIVHSKANRGALINNFGVDASVIHVIPHGVTDCALVVPKNVARRECGISADSFAILFFGSLRPDKGLSVLFDAMVIITQQNPRIKLIVAGAPSRVVPASWVERSIRDLGIKSHVELRLDWISSELASQLFAASDLVVLPYTRFDSQSGVLAQAYQFRIPLIVSNVGSLGETVKRDLSGLVVPPGDPEMLAQAVLAMMRSPRLCQILKTNMDDAMLKGKYSWSRVARLTLDAYKACLDKEAQPRE